jgi:methionyl-tRNA formyltransferase
MRAVVFAYHNVGVRCLKVLLARGVDVALVVTHEDNPNETIWFDSVASLCREQDIPFITPEDPATAELYDRVKEAGPDIIFSFYFRNMLPVDLLSLAPLGAYNMHGSLLPRYRGRVPVNWAVLHGETETGATLHEMAGKPDAGSIVAQASVPILPDDTAHEVFGKVTVAAEQALWTILPAMMAGQIPRLPNDLSKGSYFGGRKPEDGRIDWTRPAQEVYNLHRAVAPPYPGAWTVIGNKTFIIGKARLARRASIASIGLSPGLAVVDHCILGVCGDGRALHIHALWADGEQVSPHALQQFLSANA